MQPVDARIRLDRQQAAPAGRPQTGRRPLAVGQLDLGNRSVRVLSNRVHTLPEEQIPHRRVADEHDVVDGERIGRQVSNRVTQVTGHRPHQQAARMHAVVMDPGHDVRTAEALRILERRVRNLLTGFEIDQSDHDGGGPEVDREAVDRPGRTGDFFAGRRVDDAIAVTYNRGIERGGPVGGRKMERPSLDAHLAPAHRVALHLAGLGGDATLTRQTKSGPGVEMLFKFGWRRQQLHPLRDLDDAFLAFAQGDARCRYADAGLVGGGEKRHANRHRNAVTIDPEGDHGAADENLSGSRERAEGRRENC
jgi:hypothetical protein